MATIPDEQLFGKASEWSGGENLRLSDYKGALVILRGKEFKEITTQSYGDKEAAICDLWIVDGEDDDPQGEEIAVWNGVVIGMMKRAFEKGRPMVVGIVEHGTAKSGQQPPLVLVDPTDKEFTEAVEWYKAKTAGAKKTARPAAAPAAEAEAPRSRRSRGAAPSTDEEPPPF